MRHRVMDGVVCGERRGDERGDSASDMTRASDGVEHDRASKRQLSRSFDQAPLSRSFRSFFGTRDKLVYRMRVLVAALVPVDTGARSNLDGRARRLCCIRLARPTWLKLARVADMGPFDSRLELCRTTLRKRLVIVQDHELAFWGTTMNGFRLESWSSDRC